METCNSFSISEIEDIRNLKKLSMKLSQRINKINEISFESVKTGELIKYITLLKNVNLKN